MPQKGLDRKYKHSKKSNQNNVFCLTKNHSFPEGGANDLVAEDQKCPSHFSLVYVHTGEESICFCAVNCTF